MQGNRLKNKEAKKVKGNRSLKRILVSIIIIVITVYIAQLFILAEEPPLQEIENAKEALAEAGSLHAEKYSPELVTQAKDCFDSAISTWTAQNKEWFFQRDFSRTRNFANISEKAARDAIAGAIAHEANLSESLSMELSDLRKKVKKSQFLFSSFPLNNNLKKSFTRGDMMLSEAELDYKKGDFLSCKTKLGKASNTINESVKSAISILKNDFRNYNNWIALKDKTISWSKQNAAYACLVDKYKRKCYVYKSGKLVSTYSVELGPNWMGTKKQQGDDKTPEGMYKVTKKKSGVRTKYYKALLINYPNKQDKTEFANAVNKGILPKRAKNGGLIEIHGDGGKGFDWTNGCVALINSDMDKLYKISSVGMPVNIVGSLTPLDEIISGL